jgi:hypothetical protein
MSNVKYLFFSPSENDKELPERVTASFKVTYDLRIYKGSDLIDKYENVECMLYDIRKVAMFSHKHMKYLLDDMLNTFETAVSENLSKILTTDYFG